MNVTVTTLSTLAPLGIGAGLLATAGTVAAGLGWLLEGAVVWMGL